MMIDIRQLDSLVVDYNDQLYFTFVDSELNLSIQNFEGQAVSDKDLSINIIKYIMKSIG